MQNLLKPGDSIKPIVDEVRVRSILYDSYGLNLISIKTLDGYDDINYHVFVENCSNNEFIQNINTSGYTLKIINSLDSKDPHYFDGQNQLLLHLREKNFSCPKPIRNKSGEYFFTENFPSGQHIVRLLEFIDGTVLYTIQQPSNDLFYQVGKFVAKLDQQLKDFHHPVYETHQSIWMLDAIPQLTQFMFAITEQNRRSIIEDIIKRFKDNVQSVQSQLERGIIHGDFNEHNILLQQTVNNQWYIKAIIDFGDTNYSHYLYELAITIAYMIMQGKNIDVGGYVLAGYLTIRELSDLELNLLKICVEGRICQSLVLGAYSYSQDPKNAYILTTAKIGWIILEQLWKLPEEDLLQRWKSIAQHYMPSSDS